MGVPSQRGGVEIKKRSIGQKKGAGPASLVKMSSREVEIEDRRGADEKVNKGQQGGGGPLSPR